MRPVRLLSLGALFLSAFVFLPAANAQTTSTPPAAKALLPASVLATLLQNSVHLSGTVNIDAAGVPAGSLDVTGDLAWQDQVEASLHLQSSSPLLTAAIGAASADLVVVGQKAAARVGTGAWQCSGGASASPTPAKKAKSAAKASGKSAKKGKKAKKSTSGSASGPAGSAWATVQVAVPRFGQPVDLGAETLDGAPVWHVQAKSTGSATTSATLDLYVAQSDLTLKRVGLTAATSSSPAVSVVATMDLSQYGEAVSIELPSACSGSTKAMSSLQRSVLRTVTRFLQPRSLLTLVSR